MQASGRDREFHCHFLRKTPGDQLTMVEYSLCQHGDVSSTFERKGIRGADGTGTSFTPRRENRQDVG